MPAESFTANTRINGTGETYIYTPVEETKQADFSRPVPYKMVSEDGKKTGMGWMMAQPAGRASDWTEAERQELLDMAPEILACRDKLIATLANIQKAVDERKVEIGGYQTAYSR